MYQSPIEIITKQMRTQFEDNVFKAIQDYGIVVDKEELIKALQYDRGQYEKGFADGMLAPKQSEWISVEERLPEENVYVLIAVGNSIQVARIIKGISEEEREKMKNGELPDPEELCFAADKIITLRRSQLYRSGDVWGNNLVPYYWKANGGPMEWFGQNTTHWMPLPEPPKKGGAE